MFVQLSKSLSRILPISIAREAVAGITTRWHLALAFLDENDLELQIFRIVKCRRMRHNFRLGHRNFDRRMRPG
jgi:hypothetical protein